MLRYAFLIFSVLPLLFGSHYANGQCNPNPSACTPPNPGNEFVYSCASPETLQVTQGQTASGNTTIVVSPLIITSSFGFPMQPQAIYFGAINGAPSGISVNAGSTVPASANVHGGAGCLYLSGSTSDPVGVYPVTVSLTADIIIDLGGMPMAVPGFDISADAPVTFYIQVLAGGPSLTVTANGTNPICNGSNTGSITASATGGTAPYTYTISPGGQSNTTGVFNGLVAGTYTISAVSSGGNPTGTSNAVTLTDPAPLPPPVVDSLRYMCGPDQTYILAQAPGNMVQWFDVPVGGTPISTTIGLTTPLLSATDTFWVQTTNANGCVSTRSRVIVVVDLQPFAYFIYDPWPTMVGEPTTFINQSQNGSSFEWWVNGVLESTTQGFIYTFLAEGTYDVTLVVNNGQCTDTISNSILVNPTGLSETLAAGSFRSYPNPATNRITLNWTTPQAKPVAVQLVATTGQVVLSFLPSNELSEMDLHLASLAEGLYWCRVSHANGSFSSLPVLIQR